MGGQQRDGTFSGTSLMHIMHARFAESLHRDGTREHWKRAHLALVRTPVIPVPPSAVEPPDVGERRAVGPLSVLTSSGSGVELELTIEKRGRVFGDGDFEGLLNTHGE